MAGEAGAIRAGRAYIELFTTDQKLKAGLTAAGRSVAAFGKGVTAGFRAAEQSVSALGASLLKVGAGAAAGLAVASRSFGDFAQVLAEIQSNIGKTDSTRIKDVSAAILELSKNTGAGPTEIGTIFNELMKAGKSADEVIAGVGKAVAEFAKVAKLNAEEASVTIVDAMNVFGESALDATNILSSAADSSSISLQQMIFSFQQFATVGDAAGLSMRDMAAAVGLIGKFGVKGSDAGTALRTSFQRLMGGSEEVQKVMKELGLDVRDAARNMLPLEDIITALNKALGGLNSEARDAVMYKLFGADVKAINLLMREGAPAITRFKDKMADAQSVSQKYAILMDTLQGSFQRFRAGAERASIAIGEALAGSFTRAIEIAAGFLKGIEGLVAANGDLIRSFVPVIAGVVAAGAALSALGVALKLAGVLVAALASPFGLVVIGIGAALAALYHFTDALDGLGATWKAVGDLLARGDLAGAARVGMLQLEVVHQAGALALLKIWDDWGHALLDVLQSVNAECERIWAEMGFAIQGMATLIATATNAPLRAVMMDALEVQRDQLLATIDEAEALKKEGRRGRSDRGVRSAEDALKQARQELERITDEVDQAGRPFVGPPRPDRVPAAEDIARQVGAGLEAAKKTTDARGTFSAIEAARGMVAGESLAVKADEQIAEQRKAVKELVKLNRKATPLVFT